jgi:hypothetical protein
MSPTIKFLTAPFVALAFLMFLPAIGFVLFFHAILSKLLSSLDTLVAAPAPTGMAALTGYEAGKPANDLHEVEKEVDAARSR